MAHIAFSCSKADFPAIVARVKELGAPVVSGPKPQQEGETILFRDPSGNIFEVCYPAWTMGANMNRCEGLNRVLTGATVLFLGM